MQCSAAPRDESRVRWGSEETSDCEKRKEAQRNAKRRRAEIWERGERKRTGTAEGLMPVSEESNGNLERERGTV